MKDRDARGALAVTLTHLAALIADVLGPADWRVFELEAVGNGVIDLRALDERIQSEPTGLQMSTDDVLRLAADLNQVVNAVFVMPGQYEPPTVPPIDDAFYARCRLVLECVDGGVWRVTSGEERVHSRLHSEFRDVVTMRS